MSTEKIVQPEPMTSEELQAMVLELQQEIAKIKKDVSWLIQNNY